MNIKATTTKEEFVHEFSNYSRIQKTDIRFFLDALEGYISESIEAQAEFQINGLFSLYFSTMKERDTVKVGTNEKITLPVTRKARLRLADKHRKNQKVQNRVLRPILEEIEASQTLDRIEE